MQDSMIKTYIVADSLCIPIQTETCATALRDIAGTNPMHFSITGRPTGSSNQINSWEAGFQNTWKIGLSNFTRHLLYYRLVVNAGLGKHVALSVGITVCIPPYLPPQLVGKSQLRGIDFDFVLAEYSQQH